MLAVMFGTLAICMAAFALWRQYVRGRSKNIRRRKGTTDLAERLLQEEMVEMTKRRGKQTVDAAAQVEANE